MDLKTTFGGLTLNNPFIVSSCSLTAHPDKNREFEQAGAGAIVLKSIFEEEILAEISSVDHDAANIGGYDYVSFYQKQHRLDEYCKLIRETKQACNIPVIASINCCSDSAEWIAFAKRFQEAGADAIELNVMRIESDIDYNYGALEQRHIDIVKAVRAVVTVPIIVKLGHNLTNVVPLVARLRAEGASAVVLFNKMCPLDFDIESLNTRMGEVLSDRRDLSEVLRWTALCSAKVPQMPLLASGGVADGESMVKALLAGATAVEVCSALYSHGPAAISQAIQYLTDWMQRHHFESVSQFRARLNASHRSEGENFERIQFFSNISKKA